MLSPSFHDETIKHMGEVRIVLVEPSHPGNIGGAARAMKTMGLDALYLVRPGRFPDPQADWRASQAVDVVAAAAVVDSIDDAIGDCALAIGTSTRERRIPWPQGQCGGGRREDRRRRVRAAGRDPLRGARRAASATRNCSAATCT